MKIYRFCIVKEVLSEKIILNFTKTSIYRVKYDKPVMQKLYKFIYGKFNYQYLPLFKPISG